MHQHRIIEDTVWFWFASNDTSGSGGDGASPVFDVRLAGAAAGAIPVLSGSATLLTHANFPPGCHEVAIPATSGNGFSAGNTYAIFCTLLVDSQNPTGFIGSFSLEPIIADIRELGGVTQSLTDLKDFADEGYDPATNKVEGVKLVDTTTTNTDMVTEPPTAVQNRQEMDSNSTELAKIGTIPALDGASQTIGAAIAKIADDNSGADFDATTDSLQAIRDRGDAAWITGGGGGITDIINIQPLIPFSIDLANTAIYRFGLMLINSLDDLPSTAEITPGTISIDRKVIGGTSWSSIVSDAAMSEIAGLVYYDEVIDSGTGYAEGDSIRVTMKSVKVTVAANDYEIVGAAGRIFYTSIRQTMVGTNNASTASAVITHDGKLDTVDSNVDDIKAKTDNLPVSIKKNIALSSFPFFMVDSSSRPDGKTGLSVTCQRSIDGGIFSNCTNSAVEVSNGWYKINLSATDLNGDTIALKFIASGSDGRQITIITDT